MNHWNYTEWMWKVETYLGCELPPEKYVWFFTHWFNLQMSPRLAAQHFTIAWNGPVR